MENMSWYPVLEMTQRKTVDASMSMEGLAQSWFEVAPKQVHKDMIDDLFAFDDNKDVRSCAIIQIIGNTVYMPEKKLTKPFYNGRLRDVLVLLHKSSQATDLPDADLLVCCSDGGAIALAKNQFTHRVPVLSPVAWPTIAGREYAIPVPMLARDNISFWESNPIKLLRSRPLNDEIDWSHKRPQAVFRGTSKHKRNHWEKPPAVGSSEYRRYLAEALGPKKQFDVAVNKWMPEDQFENYMLIMIIGNSGGWADRTVQTLFKSSVAFLVDQAVSEWYFPLLHDRVNWMVSSPQVPDIESTVEDALRNQSLLREIVSRQNRFAHDFFSEDSLVQYMILVVKQYAERLSYVPALRTHMIMFDGGFRSA